MSLATALEQSRTTLADRWVSAANAVYPFATAGFLRTSPNAFANPVGQRSRELADLLFRAVTGQAHDGNALRAALEEFVRVRAIQDIPAENALAVIFAYKSILRDFIRERNITLTPEDDALLLAVHERCDTLALLAFGIYTRVREVFFTARIDDMRRRNSQVMRLAKRHGLAVDALDETESTMDTAL
jgi:hypothetical protein